MLQKLPCRVCSDIVSAHGRSVGTIHWRASTGLTTASILSYHTSTGSTALWEHGNTPEFSTGECGAFARYGWTNPDYHAPLLCALRVLSTRAWADFLSLMAMTSNSLSFRSLYDL